MENETQFGLLFIVMLVLLPFGEMASIMGIIAAAILLTYAKK